MKNKYIYNNKNRKTNRRYLRGRMTNPEKLLWAKIRRKQLGVIFRRQYSIGPYIVDFYCPRKRIVIELDGQSHVNTKDYDEYRTSYLEALDIKVIRFVNEKVSSNIDEVVKVISEAISPSSVEGVRGSTR